MDSYQKVAERLTAAGYYRKHRHALRRAAMIYEILAANPDGLRSHEITIVDQLSREQQLSRLKGRDRDRCRFRQVELSNGRELYLTTKQTLTVLKRVGLVASEGRTKAQIHRVVA